MARKFRTKVILAKTEVTYGTDPTPTGAANAILTKDLTIQLMQGDTVNRDVDRPSLGNDLTYHTGPYTAVTFKCEIAGSGAAGTAPAWAPLLLACGFAETINAGVSAVYDPISTAEPSVTIYFHMDGILHELNGCRGTCRFILETGQLPYIEFTFMGLRQAAAAVADPAADFSLFQAPLAVNNANTPTFSLHGFAANMDSCTIDYAAETPYQNRVNVESIAIVDRGPSGTVVIEDPALADKDYHAIIEAHTTGALQLIHGTAAGNIITFDAPAVQLLSPSITEEDGVAMLNMAMNLIPVVAAGNDELQITLT